MTTHCADNVSDRELGKKWERNFCFLAADFGKVFTPLQIVQGSSKSAAAFSKSGTWHTQLLPDVTIWSAPGEHHEIKHKNPNRHGSYGLEEYRLIELLRFARVTGQRVLYTIHDWQHAGAEGSGEEMPNRIDDWFYVDVNNLRGMQYPQFSLPSWVGGVRKEKVPQRFWPKDLWRPLVQLWSEIAA